MTTEYTTAVAAVSGAAAHGTARRAMIDSQLRTSGVNEPYVLAAMARVAREDFVPEAQRDAAYIDRAIALGGGRYLAAPLVHGKMLTAAAPGEDDKALLVTSGSDYLAALLRPMVGSLDTVDAADAVNGVAGSGYSLIIIDGAIEQLPEALAAALAADGRIITGVVEAPVTRIATGCKVNGAVTFAHVADIAIPVLAEFAAPKRWSF